jgi:hypothetical protein
MRRGLYALATAAVVAAVAAPTAGALEPTPGLGQVVQNASTVTQGANGAAGGPAQAIGGNGGGANSGNVQVLNGNSVSIAVGPNAHSDSQGGDTSAKSGDAQGGDGGNAKASGGDAKAGNVASVKQSGGGKSANTPKVLQGDNEAEGGPAQAAGGDGGSANSGNLQLLNGNSASYAAGKKAKAESQGGDTSAKSGDAYGGDGGNAKAGGGDAKAGNVAHVDQKGEAHGKKKHRPCDKVHVVKDATSGGGANRSTVWQGWKNVAFGGPAQAEGGRGGFANSGNVQEGNGNSFAKAESWEVPFVFDVTAAKCCLPKKEKGPEASSEGGDTSATSGDAEGGDGGNAKATGGDAVAGNLAKVAQLAG